MAGIQNTILFSQGEKLETSSAADITQMQTNPTDVGRINHSGNPQGVVSANPSSFCHDPVSGNVYIKASGTGNTGWVQIGGELTSPPVGSLAYFANKNGDTYVTTAGWLKCDGSILSQATYPLLYARMGLINGPGVNWTSRTIGGQTVTYLAATYGSNYLISGVGGYIRSSTDGITWATRTSGVSTDLGALTFGGGLYVYAGVNGAYGTSTDGITWTTKNPSIGQQAAPGQGTYGPFLAYNSGTIVGGVRDPGGGGVLTSTDGVTWTTRDNTLNTHTGCGGVVYAGGKFVAGFLSGQICTSTNGITWTAQVSGTTTGITSVTYGNGLYLAAQIVGTTMLSSTDAVTWTTRTPSIGGNPANQVCFGAGVYVITGFAGNKYSTDLVTWTSITPGSNIGSMVYNGTIFVGGAASGGIRTSTDGITWAGQTSQTTSTITSLIYTGSLHVYGTQGGGIGTSTDGITWVARTSGTTSNINALLYDGTLYHAAGCNFTLTSTDAITWTTNTGYTATTSTIRSLLYAGSQYVLAGQGGLLKTSPDGVTWTSRTSGTVSNINALTYGSVYAYAADGGGISTSTDAITWNTQVSGTTSNLSAINYNGSVYNYAGVAGVLASSTNGVTWTSRTSNTTSNLTGLASQGAFSVGVGAGGASIQSDDGVTWYSRVSTTSTNFNAVTHGGPVFVAVGVASTAQTSPTDYLYDETTQFQLPTDNQLLITVEASTNFFRSLYIKATL